MNHGHFGNKPDGSAMNNARAPVDVAILVFPETTASVTYGIYDLLKGAGRDWGIAVSGHAGPELMRPCIVAASATPFIAANGVMIAPHATIEDRPDARIVCVSEMAIPPDEPLSGRFEEEIAWLRRCHAQGATLATACSGALLLAEAGLLDGLDATTHWA
jgi:transcriptional regulator GlxA family with amidase domain